jgi:hypothetical protein
VQCRNKKELKDVYLKEATELLYDQAEATIEKVRRV